MKAAAVFFGSIVVLAIIIGVWVLSSYNGLVTMQETISNKWGNVENAYQRRADLVPNIVETVKGYAKHEHDTITEVVKARASIGQIKIDPSNITPEQLKQFETAQQGLSGALQKLLVVTENYPNLKADSAFTDLRATLEGCENRIARERQLFNDAVGSYNSAARRWPASMLFNFESRAYFKAQAGTEKAPTVKFGSD